MGEPYFFYPFMKHWETYLQKQNREWFTQLLPDDFLADRIVIIPCYNEPEIEDTLESVGKCNFPASPTIVLVVINSGVQSSTESIDQNHKTYQQMLIYASEHSSEQLLFVPVIYENLPRKHAGVGLARKIGMDLAIDYFFRTRNPNGVLISLDADCTVSSNFMVRISESFSHDKALCCTIHNFHHRVENNDLIIENAIRQYESYLRYFENALRYTGFPYYYHTIGSAFAITADAYVRVGGMGRQQGGEDFYFLQKIFQIGKTELLDDVFVFPMARFSNRVPFGTGPALQKIIAENDGLMQVYSFDAFVSLRQFFDLKDSFFGMSQEDILQQIKTLSPALQQFIAENDILSDIQDCNANSSTLKSFQKRFFHHFNAFKIIKYLNFAHQNAFQLESLKINIDKYSKIIGF